MKSNQFLSEVRKTRRALDASRNRLDEAIAEAKRKGLRGDELQKEVSEWWFDYDLANEDYQEARTNALIKKARNLEVPIPRMTEKDGMWDRGNIYGQLRLTNDRKRWNVGPRKYLWPIAIDRGRL
jgi:hypothetical protein